MEGVYSRLRITELWVAEDYQKQGIGHALVNMNTILELI